MNPAASPEVSQPSCRGVVIGSDVVADLQHPDLPEEVRHPLFLREWGVEAVGEVKVLRGVCTLVQEVRKPTECPENDSVVPDDRTRVEVDGDGAGRTERCL